MAFSNGYGYKRKITIDYTKVVGGASLSNFPVLIKGTLPYLKTVANGGKVEHASGYDIRFETTGGSKLDHEIVKWNATTGDFVAWVKIGTLSHLANTEIYLYYGKSGLVASEQNINGVWDSNYKGVWHLSGSYNDSTASAYNLSNGNAPASDPNGKFAGAYDFEKSSNNYITIADASAPNLEILGALTYQIYIKPESLSTYNIPMAKSDALGSLVRRFINDSGGNIYFGVSGLTVSQVQSTVDITADNWAKLVGVWDPAAGKLKIFVNGTKTEVASSGTPNDTNAPLYIGVGNGATHLDGLACEARISNVARSDGWILTEDNNENDIENFYSIGVEELPGGLIGKPLEYAVRSSTQIVKAIDYFVIAPKQITKALQYAVATKSVGQLSKKMEYYITDGTYTNKYNKQNTVYVNKY